MARPMSLMIDGWMPSVGSSRMSRRGRMHQRAGDGELLLLPAGEDAAARGPACCLQHREAVEDVLGTRCGRAGLAERSRSANSPRTVSMRKDVAALRHVADAAPRAAPAAAVGQVAAVEDDRAAGGPAAGPSRS